MEHEELIFLHVIIGLAMVLGLACILYLISRKTRGIPYTVLLTIGGMVLASLQLEPLEAIRLTPSSVLYIFLPILLFESAFNFDFREFRRILAPGFLLATVGLMISAWIVALPLMFIFSMDLAPALLLGSVISSTDPIAVLALFKRLGVPKKLQLLVDGESFLNDGTSVILFNILLSFAIGEASGFQFGDAFSIGFNFLYVIVGGVILGGLFGLIWSEIIAHIKNVDSVEITLTIILAHIVFIACEYMGVSGIIGVLASGLVLGNYGRTKISPKISHNMYQMWDFLVFVTTSIVFLLIGYEINLPSLWGNIEMVAITTGTLLLGRAISVYGIFGIYNIFVETSKKIPFKWMHVSNWGGLRGALPLIIILSIPSGHEEMRELFLQIVLGAILFTLVINALTIEPLIRFLQLNKLSSVNRVELKITELFVLQGLVRKLKKLRKINEIGEDAYKMNHDIVSEKLEKDKKLIEGWIEKKSAKYLNQMDKVLRRYCLIVERSTYYSLFKKGLLPEIVFNKLHQSFSEQLEKLDEGEEQFIASIDPVKYAAHAKVGSRSFKLTWFEQLLMKVDPYISLQDKLLSYNYKYHKARLLGDEKVLDELKEFEKDDLIPKKVLFGIMQLYQELMEHNRRTIDELVARHHDLCDRVDCQFVQLEANELIEEVLHEFGEQGRISPKALQTFQLKL